MTIGDSPGPHGPRLYGRRRGKRLRQGRQDLVETLLPQLRLPAGTIEPAALFVRPVTEVWLEIGFGGGEHLAEQAARHPEVGFIGCEAFVAGVAKLLTLVRDHGLDNVRILDDDARPLLERLPEASVGRVFLLFPDPWPKRRHAPRRFIQGATLDGLARILRPGGELRVATDDSGYASWTLEKLTAHPAFQWGARGPGDWRSPPADWAETRYETKAKRAGRSCVYLSFQRRGGAAGRPQ